MKRIKVNSVLPGDVLFTARSGNISKKIRFFTNGEVSHAMICVAHGSFIDSTSDGVQARSIQREFFDEDEEVFHFRLKDAVASEVMNKIIHEARSDIGARYSVLQAAKSAVQKSGGGSRRQFCSRLVARAYRAAGIDLVPNADYCTPEDLRRSPLLLELEAETERVSDEELSWYRKNFDPIQSMHDAQNKILKMARSYKSNVESFNDLYQMLVDCPECDASIGKVLVDSGYLNIWRTEVEKNPWRYNYNELLMVTKDDNVSVLKEYCIETVKEAYTSGERYAINYVALVRLSERYERISFGLEVDLYEVLLMNEQNRREVAYRWLNERFADDLKLHMEQIVPHSERWFQVVELVDPRLAQSAKRIIKMEKSLEVCSFCGDKPLADYRLVNGAQAMPGVPSFRLCEECVDIREGMGNNIEIFIR